VIRVIRIVGWGGFCGFLSVLSSSSLLFGEAGHTLKAKT